MTDPLSDPFYLLPPLVASAACLTMAWVVWRDRGGNFSRLMFCLLLLCVSLWSLLVFGMRSAPNVEGALAWQRVMVILYYATYALYYHFTISYTNSRGQRGVLFASYSLVLLAAALAPTTLLIRDVRLESYGYAPVLGPVVPILSVSGIFLMAGGAYNLVRRYQNLVSYEERNRIIYLLIALHFLLSGGFP